VAGFDPAANALMDVPREMPGFKKNNLSAPILDAFIKRGENHHD
jgi:hypothetical protein